MALFDGWQIVGLKRLWLFTFLLVALAAFFPRSSVSIKWLALHRVQPPWNESGNCPRTKEERKVHGLINYQARICARLPELMPHIISAATLTVDLCQWTVADRRWNCSSVLRAPHLTNDLTSGTKEQAFVHALSSAAVTHQIAKACSSGQIANCPCGFGDSVTTTSISSAHPSGPPAGGNNNLLQPNLTELSYKWKGCSDNVIHGRRISREWSDAKWRPNPVDALTKIATKNRWNILEEDGGEDVRLMKLKRQAMDGKRSGQKARMNEFNNEIGRQIAEQSLYKKCKCHGVSSSCDVKTCWYTLPPFEQIAETLRQRYDMARPMLSMNNSKRRWKSVEDSRGWQNLVYLRSSSNYCEQNVSLGSVGTRSRECNISSFGTDSCESLCCGRGFFVSQMRVEENCQCKYLRLSPGLPSGAGADVLFLCRASAVLLSLCFCSVSVWQRLCSSGRLHHFSSLRSLFWRRKRGTELEAPTRTFSNNESPCPRGDWQRHMLKVIIPTDPSISVHAVHSSLSQLYDDPMPFDEHGHSNTFLLMVTCANATAFGPNQSDGQKGAIPSGVSLISSGRNFCNVRVREAGGDHSLWCQAVAIVA
uniref:Protein Wnt n=1 Tax=Globodera pallida TaxID=36090 RepID=A0A183CLE2_GLOPA